MSFCGLKQALLCGGGKKGISNITITSYCNQKSNQNNAEDLNIDKAKNRDNSKKPTSNETIFDEDIILDGELTLQFSSTLNTTASQQKVNNNNKQKKTKQQRLLLNMSRNAAIIDDENKLEHCALYKLLQQCSMSKSANIPMIVVKTFVPSNDDEFLPPAQPSTNKFSGLRLFANITKSKQFKQIEIHRGMTINALFSRENWLYIKTAQNESGYVPLDTCKPVIFKRQQKSTKSINATNVSLLDISKQEAKVEQNAEEVFCDDEDENLSELEFSQYDNKNINEYMKLKQQQLVLNDSSEQQHDSIRLFKIKHYFKSLQVETNLDTISVSTTSSQQQTLNRGSIALDSGYSDTDSNIVQSRYFSQSYELLSQICAKPAHRRGIKTNGSICSISPNNQQQLDTISKASSMQSLNLDEQQQIEEEQQDDVKQIIEKDFAYKTARPNLSTIIEQSYNSTCELQRAASHSLLANNSLAHSVNRCDLSNFQTISSSKNSTLDLAPTKSAADATCYRQVIEDYEPLFVEDLSVVRGELVTVLEDENPEWCYVISQNGKGYIPRSCIQFEINL